ncbi:hypothetical protein PLEOSDRAFT_1090872 [Pleurotus ostreatus PC15]|uniref:Uncharacterized protein n=1 Tax=Pleurotus ostreatus (strain PC15) TaxID=1137138 RepID=A0A067N646_PLEO1|nr:hypothetical protein PLEOSDRAFT_1090872 [Pleurotus ostreatus PC15]
MLWRMTIRNVSGSIYRGRNSERRRLLEVPGKLRDWRGFLAAVMMMSIHTLLAPWGRRTAGRGM